MNWDEYFLKLAKFCSSKSKDKNTKVGAVIVGPDHEIRSTGYNSFPRGVDDSVQERYERPEKYYWTEHAERNAIYNAARTGIPLKDCILYTDWIPCIDCARACVQAGIKEIIIDAAQETKWNSNPQWIESQKRSEQLFKETGINVRSVILVDQEINKHSYHHCMFCDHDANPMHHQAHHCVCCCENPLCSACVAHVGKKNGTEEKASL